VLQHQVRDHVHKNGVHEKHLGRDEKYKGKEEINVTNVSNIVEIKQNCLIKINNTQKQTQM
jgi:hypothetical protein